MGEKRIIPQQDRREEPITPLDVPIRCGYQSDCSSQYSHIKHQRSSSIDSLTLSVTSPKDVACEDEHFVTPSQKGRPRPERHSGSCSVLLVKRSLNCSSSLSSSFAQASRIFPPLLMSSLDGQKTFSEVAFSSLSSSAPFLTPVRNSTWPLPFPLSVSSPSSSIIPSSLLFTSAYLNEFELRIRDYYKTYLTPFVKADAELDVLSFEVLVDSIIAMGEKYAEQLQNWRDGGCSCESSLNRRLIESYEADRSGKENS
ncbi:uncharacterized protein MONOS_5620 [Monocercomonoides exilis]|uniref:uncharacterized protein n=1 Tax=Monocercomonoides exilis TaxID=2049356 RepID=UPI00355A0E6A|nr:hypothetical protein MONOS_5620 [Monocercomonoides exilis]|eukprot:MONOS_5620.1-p1 / transcript=MONOS_5620.1 / gene=MONOS_5620 / organism=Monocercomonoides_exilis_PA203 / gene_product=unspecified product / transcript_product=unspecified product / location=Mono_scaffold00166:7273-8304(-) / protein_length=256 / sequence_SO=supercontig / SO=protein_coding / is_pseudo=false